MLVSVERIGWVVFWFLAALGISFGVAGVAHCEPLSLTEKLIAAQHLKGVQHFKEPAVDERELASLIVESTHGNATLSALVLTMASAETGLRARIAADHCMPRECDHGRAVGIVQSHKLAHGATLKEQVEEAARELKRTTSECHGLPFPLSAMRAYGSGGGCYAPIPRETERVELFKRIRRTLN